MKATFNEIDFTDDDVVNLDDWVPEGSYNPHNVRPWLLHDSGFVLAVVFASSLQDALDIAADEDELDCYLVSQEEHDKMSGTEQESLSYLGNAGEPFDIEALDAIELPNPPRSFVAQFNVRQE